MVTADEAMKSDDPKIVKRLRGSINSQLSCDVHLLEKELDKKTDGKFDLGRISHQLIKVQRKKLTDHFEVVQNLHDRYVQIRQEGEDDQAEESLVTEDSQYLEVVTRKVCAVLDGLSLYDEALAESAKIKGLNKSNLEARESCVKAKNDFNLVYSKVMEEINIIESLEDKSEAKLNNIQTLPTEALLRNICAAFGEVKRASNKLKDSSSFDSGNSEESKVALNYEDEYAKYMDVEVKLKRYDQVKVPPKHVIAGDIADTVKAVPLKINKPDTLVFSGQARDFAAFKRDFMAIVVPHRDAPQIGIYLKQAIPEKHKHLVSNKELHEWQDMLDILEDELAAPKIIIDQTVGEIERMKTPTTDRAFIEFVDSLEKIQRDLTTLDQLS